MKKILFLSFSVALILCSTFSSFTAYATEVNETAPIRYSDPNAVSVASYETFNYTSSSLIEKGSLANGCPSYYSTLSNSCGAVAGANVVGFYDRYYEELVPNYSTYFHLLDCYYGADNTAIPNLISNLFTLMRTNVDGDGCTQAEFVSGLSQYISNKGRNFSYSSIASNGNLNYTTLKSEINQGRIVVLFSYPSELYTKQTSNNQITLQYCNFTAPHILVVYGYEKYSYTLTNGSTRTDTYLNVSSNLPGYINSLFKINSYEDIVDCISINIS